RPPERRGYAPPLLTVAVSPSPATRSLPPLDTVVPLATPPDEMVSAPPFRITVPTAEPWDSTVRRAPEPTVVRIAVPPDCTSSRVRLLMPETVTKPDRLVLLVLPDSSTIWPPDVALVPAAVPPLISSSPPNPIVVALTVPLPATITTAPEVMPKPEITPPEARPPEPTVIWPPLSTL